MFPRLWYIIINCLFKGCNTLETVPVPPTFSKIAINYIFNSNSITSTEYFKELLLKGAEICLCEDDKPTSLDTPPPLASAHEYPDRDLILLFSHYKQ